MLRLGFARDISNSNFAAFTASSLHAIDGHWTACAVLNLSDDCLMECLTLNCFRLCLPPSNEAN